MCLLKIYFAILLFAQSIYSTAIAKDSEHNLSPLHIFFMFVYKLCVEDISYVFS